MTRQIEPEWDDATRESVEGLDQFDAECCPGCGLHKSITGNLDEHHFVFEEGVCGVCASQDRYGRVVAERDHEATPKNHDGHPAWDGPRTPRPTDGRHITLRPMSDAEVERRRRD